MPTPWRQRGDQLLQQDPGFHQPTKVSIKVIVRDYTHLAQLSGPPVQSVATPVARIFGCQRSALAVQCLEEIIDQLLGGGSIVPGIVALERH